MVLQRRFRSRAEAPFSDKVLAAMRQRFGGHAVKTRGVSPRMSVNSVSLAGCRAERWRIVNERKVFNHNGVYGQSSLPARG